MELKENYEESYFVPSIKGDALLGIICTPEFRKSIISDFKSFDEKKPLNTLLFRTTGGFVKKDSWLPLTSN